MHTLTFRDLTPARPEPAAPDGVLAQMGRACAELIDAEIHATETPVLAGAGATGEVARYLRWQSHNTRHRLVLETTWHRSGIVVVDAAVAASPLHKFAALWELIGHAARNGYTWLAAWWENENDPVLKDHFFDDAHSASKYAGAPMTVPLGRVALADGLVAEWLRLTPRHMSRLLRFAWDCRIEWESLIVEDLMTRPPVTYVELRGERDTIALARVLRRLWLPGQEGYDPRSRTPPVELEIESLEVHPEHKGCGHGQQLVRVVQALQRPVSSLDTYRRAEPFWHRAGFRPNPRRSAREDSNILEWAPATGAVQRLEIPVP